MARAVCQVVAVTLVAIWAGDQQMRKDGEAVIGAAMWGAIGVATGELTRRTARAVAGTERRTRRAMRRMRGRMRVASGTIRRGARRIRNGTLRGVRRCMRACVYRRTHATVGVAAEGVRRRRRRRGGAKRGEVDSTEGGAPIQRWKRERAWTRPHGGGRGRACAGELWAQGRRVVSTLRTRVTHAVLRVLLFIGGIEPNPGPKGRRTKIDKGETGWMHIGTLNAPGALHVQRRRKVGTVEEEGWGDGWDLLTMPSRKQGSV